MTEQNAVVTEPTNAELLAEVQKLTNAVGALTQFVEDLKGGAREAVRMGGIQGTMAKNLIPPALLS